MLVCILLPQHIRSQQKREFKTISVDGAEFNDLNGNGILEPYEDTRLPYEQRTNDLISRLSIDEKISLVMGTGMVGFEMLKGFDAVNPPVPVDNFLVPGSAGSTMPIPRLGIPAVVMADGPAGVRISPTRKNDSNTYYATGFPVGTLLASTWNVDLVERVGRAMGNETLEYGCDILLSPALNIMRDPLCGRNFEYYSEDPLISGKIAAAATRGIQYNGAGVSLKHFAANNSETNRMLLDVHVSQRALREIYLRGFEIAVKESNPHTIMSSYNKINGTYTSASHELLTTLLRDEWAFKGLVMTDWFGGYGNVSNLFSSNEKVEELFTENYTSEQIKAGNDLLMPGIIPQINNLKADLNAGIVTEADIDVCVRRVIRLILDSPALKGYAYSNKPDLAAHAQVTREAATEGMVLLENKNNALPIDEQVANVALFGSLAYQFIAGGTGSGDVHKAYTVSLVEGLKNAGYTLDEHLNKTYTAFVAKEAIRIQDLLKEAPFMPVPLMQQPPVKKLTLEKTAARNDIAIITIGRSSGEMEDRKVENDFNLSAQEVELIHHVSDAFRAQGKKVVVVLNVGGVIETASWRDAADAILMAWLPGQEGGNSVADVLTGKANPSGRLTMTFPISYADMPTAGNFKGFPVEDPKDVYYEDEIYVGYRHFTTKNKPTAYEFGYGLSYTTFDYSNICVSNDAFLNELYVTADITNTGDVAGKEVVQLYLSAPANEIDKPVKELKAFVKTKQLAPGEKQTVYFRLTPRDLASFVPKASAWVAEKGQYTIEIAKSVLTPQLTGLFVLDENIVVEQTNNILNKK